MNTERRAIPPTELNPIERAALTAARWSWALLSALTLSCNMNPVPEDPGLTHASEGHVPGPTGGDESDGVLVPGMNGDGVPVPGEMSGATPPPATATGTATGVPGSPPPTDTPMPTAPTTPPMTAPTTTTPPAAENPTEEPSTDASPGVKASADGGVDAGPATSRQLDDGSVPFTGDVGVAETDAGVDGGAP